MTLTQLKQASITIKAAMKSFNIPLTYYDEIYAACVEDYSDSDISKMTVSDVAEIIDSSINLD